MSKCKVKHSVVVGLVFSGPAQSVRLGWDSPEKVHDGTEEIIEESELSPGRVGPQTHQC